MHPILLQMGPLTVSTYTALIGLGVAAALAALYWQAPAGQGTRWLDAGLAATVGGVIGARLVYTAVNADYYLPHLEEIVQVWQGGLAWPGAAVGALAGAWVYTRQTGERLGPILDALALPIAALSLLGWSGCLAAGCAYGYEVAPGQLPGWFTSLAPDLYGLVLPRFPTQALGMAGSLLALAAVWGALRSRRGGWGAGAYGAYALSLAALGIFGLSFTRGDPTPLVSGYRLDTAGSALVLLLATGLWIIRLRSAPLAADAPATAAADAPSTTAAEPDAAPLDSITQP